MAPVIKLTYFNVMALAEPIRILLKYGGIDFEDDRFERDEWPERKPKMPFGQVPVYEENGKIVHQSMAVARYLAKKVNLVGATDWEDLEIDSIVDTINDMRQKVTSYTYELDAVIKESRKAPLFDETLPFYLNRLDEIARKNNGHLAVGKLTWADVYFVGLLDSINSLLEMDLIEKYENLIVVKNNVLAVPAIKKWFETRPKTV